MISLSNSKINLGLEIKDRREDGYHNIESIFLPLPYGDVLECFESAEDDLLSFGIDLDFPKEDNILWKGWKYMKEKFELPSMTWYLYKQVPPGTGIGAGSGNLGAMLNAINNHFKLQLSKDELSAIALKFGSDTGFFIYNSACLVKGRGDIIEEVSNPLHGKYLFLFKPESVSIRTSEAFANAKGNSNNQPFTAVLAGKQAISELSNDFEAYFGHIHPKFNSYKMYLKEHGASYVSLSGSGSCFYAVFEEKPEKVLIPEDLQLLWYGQV